MSTVGILLLVVVFVLAGYLALRLVAALRYYFRFRGKRLVICPETHRAAAVDVATGKAAISALTGKPRLKLHTCSRWPERADCPQECVPQIAASPERTKVESIANEFYSNQACIYCHKPIGQTGWFQLWLNHKPALMDAARETAQWNEVPPEQLPDLFASHRPVCWNCHIIESFRRKHADLVTQRPQH